MNGHQSLVTSLYPAISYPVGRGTPMLNSKIVWDHSTHYPLPKMYADSKFQKLIWFCLIVIIMNPFLP